jgi:hypothetical protein
MPASQHDGSAAISCFLLTDIRVAEGRPRTVLIDSCWGRDLTATMTKPPRCDSLVQFDLGDLGWVDGVVQWTEDHTFGIQLQHEIADAAFTGVMDLPVTSG